MPIPVIEPDSRARIDDFLPLTQFRAADWQFSEWQAGAIQDSQLGPTLMAGTILNLKRVMMEEGAAILRLGPGLFKLPPELSATCCTLIASVLGIPIRVFRSQPHWRPLYVDPTRPPERSGGVGRSALHMDFVNAAFPPDIVLLLCVRKDPAGGGQSLVSRILGIESMLSKEDITFLSQPIFRDGVVQNLDNVGEDINPFPVLSLATRWQYRFTGNLAIQPDGSPVDGAINRFYDLLQANTFEVNLEEGDLLVLNQHIVLHGRAALGPGQENVPSNMRRFLLHSFIRFANTPS